MSTEVRWNDELKAAIEYFREKGWEIEVCGGMKDNALIIDFEIGGLNFPNSLISSGKSSFAIIPKDRFEKLEKSGIITDVVDKKLIDISGEIPAKLGKADVTVKGRFGRRTFQGVSVVGVKFHPEYKWGAILGREFVNSFDATEMGWPGDPVVGFYGCRRIKS